MILYKLQDLVKAYHGKSVLSLEKLDIEQGRIHALVGANGAGKTTLLNILAFLDRPSSGSIHYASQPVVYMQTFLQSIRKEIILVHQHPVLFSTSVYHNLDFGLKIRNTPKNQRREMIAKALRMVGMEHKIDAQPKTLSGGEIQRTALARAMVLEPKVLLCDEPTAYVDLEHRNIIMELLRDINTKQKATIIFTTHDKQQAVTLAHHTITLERGKLIDSSYDNFYTGVITPDQNGWVRCRIQNTLEIKIPSEKIGTRRVFIDPEKIQWTTSSAVAPNHTRLRGEVIQISSEQDRIRIQVRSAIPITFLLSQKDYQQRSPRIGQHIDMRIPPDAIKIL